MTQPLLNIHPTLKQYAAWQMLWDSEILYVIFGGGAGGGKSWFSAEWLLDMCRRYPGTRWFVGRKELKRLRSTWFLTWMKVCRHHGVKRGEEWKYNGQDHYIEFTNGSRIDFLDLKNMPSDPMFERLGSTEYTGGLIEEAGEVAFMAFDVLKSRIGRHLNDEYGIPPKILMTCNPNKRWLYRIVYKPWKEGILSPYYGFVQALYRDNPHTAQKYESTLSQITDNAMRRRLKDGDWEYEDADNSLVSYDAIMDIFNNTGEKGERYISGDIARFGRDTTVGGVWEGFVLYRIEVLEQSSIPDSQKLFERLEVEERVARSRIALDEVGVGGGVIDYMPGVKGFIAGASAMVDPKQKAEMRYGDEVKKPNYKNLRSQCGYMLAGVINDRRIAITAELTERQKEMIIEELEQLRSKDVDKDAPLQLIPKDEMKQAINRSPDFLDMFMIRMYHELQPVTAEPRIRML